MDARFLTLPEVAEVLNTSQSQVYALVRGKHPRAIKIGGRGQWRVETKELDEYIERTYAETEQWIDAHPYTGQDNDEEA